MTKLKMLRNIVYWGFEIDEDSFMKNSKKICSDFYFTFRTQYLHLRADFEKGLNLLSYQELLSLRFDLEEKIIDFDFVLISKQTTLNDIKKYAINKKINIIQIEISKRS